MKIDSCADGKATLLEQSETVNCVRQWFQPVFLHTTIYSYNIVFTVFPAIFVGEFLLGIALLLNARS